MTARPAKGKSVLNKNHIYNNNKKIKKIIIDILRMLKLFAKKVI